MAALVTNPRKLNQKKENFQLVSEEAMEWISPPGDKLAGLASCRWLAFTDTAPPISHIHVGLSVLSQARGDRFGERGQRVFRGKERTVSQVLVNNRLCS